MHDYMYICAVCSQHLVHPDITVMVDWAFKIMVDWALKINYLSIYLSIPTFRQLYVDFNNFCSAYFTINGHSLLN